MSQDLPVTALTDEEKACVLQAAVALARKVCASRSNLSRAERYRLALCADVASCRAYSPDEMLARPEAREIVLMLAVSGFAIENELAVNWLRTTL